MIRDEKTACPEISELRAFAVGDLGEARIELLAKHIDRCDSCGEVIDGISNCFESELISGLRQLDSASKLDAASYAGNVVGPIINSKIPENVLQAAFKAADPLSIPVSFDAGKRLANRLKQGPVHLGRFELKSELGVGAFGYVFKAFDSELSRYVALKVQRAGTFASDEDVERFLREAQSIAQLNHPGIVAVYDSIRSEEDTCYLVTEFVDGKSLELRLREQDFSFAETADLIALIGDALQYAHEHGIVHRDVKPSNVIIDHDQKPHVMDFGLAKRDFDTGNEMTSIGRVMGTPAYMSPEQALGDSRDVSPRSDVYSLGVILYEMLTGERPFQGNHRILLMQVIEDEPRSPRRLKSNIPLDLETICLKALSKSPARRYQSASEFADDLRRYVRRQPIKARPRGPAEKLWRWCRTFPLAASLLVAVPLVAIGGFWYLFSLSTHFVHSTALESTRMEANMLESINEFYSEGVISGLDHDRIEVTHKYATTPHSVPLPFTFMIDAGERISQDESGMQVKIYSDFPWRPEGGPQNDFELRAIEALGLGCRTLPETENTEARVSSKSDVEGRSYHEFVDVNGEPMLRYARAQIMNQSCIDCHNHHEASPKQDWIVGEVGGVLSITRPLERDVALTRSGLKSAFYLIGTVAMFLTGLSLCVFWTAKRRTIEN